MPNVIVWVDIPVTDMERATAFYAHVTGLPIVPMPGAEGEIALIGGPGGDQGRIVSADLYRGGTPSHTGPTVYLSARGDIDGTLARVVEAGGTVLQEKQNMGEMVGWIAFIEDSEGNRIGIQHPSM